MLTWPTFVPNTHKGMPTWCTLVPSTQKHADLVYLGPQYTKACRLGVPWSPVHKGMPTWCTLVPSTQRHADLVYLGPQYTQRHTDLVYFGPQSTQRHTDLVYFGPQYTQRHADLVYFGPQYIQEYADLVYFGLQDIQEYADLVYFGLQDIQEYADLVYFGLQDIQEYADLVYFGLQDIQEHSYFGPKNILYVLVLCAFIHPPRVRMVTECALIPKICAKEHPGSELSAVPGPLGRAGSLWTLCAFGAQDELQHADGLHFHLQDLTDSSDHPAPNDSMAVPSNEDTDALVSDEVFNQSPSALSAPALPTTSSPPTDYGDTSEDSDSKDLCF